MLHDSQTDLVFIPMAIRYHFPRFYKSLIAAFRAAHVKCWELPYTSEKTCLWARDYMPITVDGKGDIAQFRYDPDYLRAPRYEKYKPDMVPIWADMEITPFRYEDIVLDGGNVLTDKRGNVYMTDKIFLENPNYPRKLLIAALKKALNARSIKIVHWDKSDIYGHVDGMMAIADDGSLITDLSWEYLNFLRVGNKIFMAQLGKPSDAPAVKRIQEAFPDCEVYPIKYAQSLTRLGGGLHCATWNTLEHGHQNAKYFKPSKRHPFNPFDDDAFTEERLRAVLEHDLKRQLSDDEWEAIDKPFYMYWNDLYLLDKRFSPNDMYNAIKKDLETKNSPYFRSDKELTDVVDNLITYMMHVPKLILPDNTEYNPKEVYIPSKVMNVHFKDTVANLTSFKIEYEHLLKGVKDELEFTKQVEKEAEEAEERKDGTIYILNYRKFDKRRISPYRYTIIVSATWRKHIRIIVYDDSPLEYFPLADYLEMLTSKINFYENYREGDCNFDENPDSEGDASDLPF